MGDDALDDLARTLARPMSRRRAVGLFGAALGAAAVPGLRPRTAGARAVRRQGQGCGAPGICSKGTVCGYETTSAGGFVGCNKGCCQNTGDPAADRATAVCCNHNHETGSWCCPEGYTCGSGANTAEDPNCHPPCDDPCPGNANRVASVQTASGDDLGLPGKQICQDQKVVAKESTRIELGDGSVVTLEAGSGFQVEKCVPEETIWDLIGAKIRALLSSGKYEIATERAVIGVRGTEFSVAYNERKKRTTVRVDSGKVQLWAKRNPKKKVVAGKGDTIIQQGNEAPKIKD